MRFGGLGVPGVAPARAVPALGVCLAFTLTGLTSPAAGLPADRSPSQYVHDAWGPREGLGRGPVEAVVQSRDGRLWLGSHQGLVRFDGFQLTLFSSANEPLLGRDMILDLLEARDGTLWIGTQDSLVRYRAPAAGAPGGFSAHPRAGAVLRGMVQALVEDAAGTLWIGTDTALLRDDGHRIAVFTTADGLPGERVLSLAAAADGGIWVGTSNGLAHWRGDRPAAVWRREQGLPDATVRSLAAEVRHGHETVWAGTAAGLAKLEDGAVTARLGTADGLPSAVIRALLPTGDGALWIGTNGGLVRRTAGGRLERLSIDDRLSREMVLSLTEDRNGHLWVGTARGLDRLRAGAFVTWSVAEGLPGPHVWAVHEDPQGRLWVGTNQGGAATLSASGSERLPPSPGGLLSHAVYSIASTADTLWFGGDRGLSRRRGGTWRSWTARDGLPSDAVLALLAGRDGTLWVGTHQGLVEWRDGPVRTYGRADGLGANVVRVLLEDRHGDLWIGTNGGGVSRLHREGPGLPEKLETWSLKDGLSGPLVLSLLEDDDGTLWVGTDGDGLSRWHGGQWSTFGEAQGLTDDKINRLLDDGRGGLWWNGANGIYRVAKAELAAVAAGKLRRATPQAFDERDGLRSAQSDGGVQSPGWRRRDGTLWWATLDGVARVDPARVDLDPAPPQAYLLEAVVDGTVVRLADLAHPRLTLPPGTRQLELRYGALDLNAEPRARFRVRLTGLDPDWIEAGERRAAFYTRLDPGRFRFEVAARHLPGAWHPHPGQVEIVMQPFFYQRWAFYALLGLAVAVALAAAHRWRIRRLEQRERELERRIAEAVAQVKVLGGLLPICMSCKKIRDDAGYWEKLETYLSEHADIVLSHGLCPDCFAKATQWHPPAS